MNQVTFFFFGCYNIFLSVPIVLTSRFDLWGYRSISCKFYLFEYEIISLFIHPVFLKSNLEVFIRNKVVSRYSRMDQVKFVEDSLFEEGIMVSLNRPYHFKFFKGCLPQVLLGPFLNSLTHIVIKVSVSILIFLQYFYFRRLNPLCSLYAFHIWFFINPYFHVLR